MRCVSCSSRAQYQYSANIPANIQAPICPKSMVYVLYGTLFSPGKKYDTRTREEALHTNARGNPAPRKSEISEIFLLSLSVLVLLA